MTAHEWEIVEISHFERGDFDVDVTRDSYGTIGTCRRCGLRVLASAYRTPQQADAELPRCDAFRAARLRRMD